MQTVKFQPNLICRVKLQSMAILTMQSAASRLFVDKREASCKTRRSGGRSFGSVSFTKRMPQLGSCNAVGLGRLTMIAVCHVLR